MSADQLDLYTCHTKYRGGFFVTPCVLVVIVTCFYLFFCLPFPLSIIIILTSFNFQSMNFNTNIQLKVHCRRIGYNVVFTILQCALFTLSDDLRLLFSHSHDINERSSNALPLATNYWTLKILCRLLFVSVVTYVPSY